VTRKGRVGSIPTPGTHIAIVGTNTKCERRCDGRWLRWSSSEYGTGHRTAARAYTAKSPTALKVFLCLGSATSVCRSSDYSEFNST
jgi:hypothetical protein